jgi:hypothetical protein
MSFAPFYCTDNQTFAKTGSGQTQEKLKKDHVPAAIDFNNCSGTELHTLGEPFQGKYSARVFTAEAVREIEKHSTEAADRGFFLYLLR